jgi:hypothetical protein
VAATIPDLNLCDFYLGEKLKDSASKHPDPHPHPDTHKHTTNWKTTFGSKYLLLRQKNSAVLL